MRVDGKKCMGCECNPDVDDSIKRHDLGRAKGCAQAEKVGCESVHGSCSLLRIDPLGTDAMKIDP